MLRRHYSERCIFDAVALSRPELRISAPLSQIEPRNRFIASPFFAPPGNVDNNRSANVGFRVTIVRRINVARFNIRVKKAPIFFLFCVKYR